MQGYAMAFILDEPKNELTSGHVKSEMARHPFETGIMEYMLETIQAVNW
jgi:hypothetical protein